MTHISGKLVLLGDNVNTDEIHPSRFFSLDSLRRRSGIETSSENQSPTIWLAGDNFGYGSSRETTIMAMIESNVVGVAARSISRIFWRNALNLGLPVLEVPQFDPRNPGAAGCIEGEDVEMDWHASVLRDPTGKELLRAEPLDEYERGLIEAGGILPWMRTTQP